MSSAAPLAALLASHPEECAAVVSALCLALLPTSQEIDNVLSYYCKSVTPALRSAVLRALVDAAIVQTSIHPVKREQVWDMANADQWAIARQGAAAWLRGRVSEEQAK